MSTATTSGADDIPPQKLRLVVAASAAGTIFEWYDFFIYGALATIMAKHFFATLPDAQALLFSLLTFSVGLVVRPIGALVFGKMGDSNGRKGAFLITIVIMGAATVAIGLLPTAAQIGPWAAALLIACRILQGFALGGEYGGAAIYVSEHAPQGRRGAATALIQASASIGLVGALGVILATRNILGEDSFREWGWRIPFLLSAVLLAISIWIRMQLEESPAFRKLKAEGKTSKRAYAESFLEWRNLKIVLLALFGLMMAQGVGWYTANFYTQIFMERILRVDQKIVNMVMMTVVIISAPLYIFFAWVSDRIGRRPVMLFGMVLMALMYFPGFHLITRAANPALANASVSVPVTITADPADCSFMLDLTGGAHQFASSCDIARTALSDAGVSYELVPAPAGSTASVSVGATVIESVNAEGRPVKETKAVRTAFAAALQPSLVAAGYPAKADPAAIDFALLIGVMVVFIIAATALYGPQAAALVELFPTRIRYTAFSLPYNVGTGWFGGLAPVTALAIVTATGNIFSGLWFPMIVTCIAIVVFFFFWPETKDRDIHL
ncbi:MAG: MFS transporter [Hyphomonadaceae bacterium]|nr:MAG: major facilitator superfamily permease [Caulobacteraceae bacterium]MBT9444210.1 MFS transporter [Hyphomonadaceae bacterium]